jgi:hypothetical protein
MTPKFCNGCKRVHDPLVSCSVARRILEASDVTYGVVVLANQLAKEEPLVVNEVINTVANNVANKSRYKDVEKRKAYMREYMRKRRGSVKAA